LKTEYILRREKFPEEFMLYFKEDELQGDENVFSVQANINYIVSSFCKN
jgi:hypothetical protein